MTEDNVASHMGQGAALHAAGQPEQALVAFERALALAPRDLEAASAVATLLSELNRPQAAYAVLQSVREPLMLHPDGAVNLGIAAEANGQLDEARACYEEALRLAPDNVRALNNLGLLASRAGRWDIAVANARRCVALVPAEPTLHLNLCDQLTGARQYAEALTQLRAAQALFPAMGELRIREVMLLAFTGEIDASTRALQALGAEGPAMLGAFLQHLSNASDRPVRKAALVLPDAWEFFTQQGFEAMGVCDWRDQDRITAALRQMLAAAQGGQHRDWRDTEFYALMLPLTEAEQTGLRIVTSKTIGALAPAVPPFRPSAITGRKDGRIRVGISSQNLADPRHGPALLAQLQLHDRTRFAIQVYSPTPQGQHPLREAILAHADNLVEVAHMTHAEAAQRIRLDRLDVWMDTAFYSPWCRPELPALRVAPVQLRNQTWQRYLPRVPCEYTVGDTFTHPDLWDNPGYGAVARFPHGCWLVPRDEPVADIPVPRADAGLPEDVPVLACFIPAVMIDPETFALWMKLLRAAPDAVLWLPSFAPLARANLAREAAAAGVAPERLIYMQRCARPEMLARMALADLFIDTLRFNANYGLVDALRMGVPALGRAGHNMASRLGGSIIRAAGLADCVYEDADAYARGATALARDPAALAALRARLQAARPQAPLFDAQARVREWEWAWAHMTERYRAGLPPEAFDIPQAMATAAAPITPAANP